MSIISSTDQAFINRLTEIILANLENEQFDVDELAIEAGMSRSYILQKLNSLASKSTTRFIREVRLQRAMEMLQHGEKTAAEVAYSVGFGSPAYFNSCFHEFYGYPPGKVIRNNNKVQQSESVSGICESFTLASDSIPVSNKQSQWNFSGSPLLFYAFIGVLILLLLAFPFLKILNRLTANRLDRADKSISVLPFKNLSNLDENQYFADGITENILNNLVQIRELKVVAINQMKELGENPMDIPRIAARLGVNFVLTGSVQHYNDKIRVFVQLIDVKHDQHIWSDKYDQKMADIFRIQSDIAKQVADQLQSVLTPKEIEQVEKIHTRSMEAYNSYLKGRFFWNRRTEEGVKKSIEYFTKAVETDPDFALAWSGLGDAYSIMAGYGWYNPKKEGEERAKLFLHKALELDENLAEAHAALGRILIFSDWKWEEADQSLSHAIGLKPNYAPARQYYSQLMDIKGDYLNAREQIDRALELDPLAPVLHRLSADLFYNEGNFERALEAYQESIALEKKYVSAYWGIFYVCYRTGEGSRALETLQNILRQDTATIKFADIAPTVYAKSGFKGLIDWLINIYPRMSQLYAISGRKEEALDCIEGYLVKSPGDALVRLINKRNYETLRSEPRFKAVVDKLGLTKYYLKRLNQPGYIPNQ